jgi:hypothetical protein
MVCHIFNLILKHIRSKDPEDRPEDFDYGPWWNRHRHLDTTLSKAFMFIPDRFRLPKNLRDPVAVHTNLNLHASVICLQNAAIEQAEKQNFPEPPKQTIRDRRLCAANEIINIMKLTSHMTPGYVSVYSISD